MNCQNCSNPLTPGAKFCGNCGAIVQSDPSVQPPQSVVATAAIAPPMAADSALYVPVAPPEVTNMPTEPGSSRPDSAGAVSVAGPALAGIILGAVYLLGSSVAYVEGFQDFSSAVFIVLASIDIFLGLLIFMPGFLLLATNKISRSALLKTEYVAAVAVVTLSAISLRSAGLLFIIPALLAKRAHSKLRDAE